MKKRLLILTVVSLLLIGCAQGSNLVRFNEQQAAQTAIKGTASTLGYFIGANNLDLIPEWNKWIDRLLGFNQGDSVLMFQNVLIKGADLVIDSHFLQLKFEEFISLFEFPRLQPPSNPFLTGPYMEMVRLVLGGFQEGLEAAEAEADG